MGRILLVLVGTSPKAFARRQNLPKKLINRIQSAHASCSTIKCSMTTNYNNSNVSSQHQGPDTWVHTQKTHRVFWVCTRLKTRQKNPPLT